MNIELLRGVLDFGVLHLGVLSKLLGVLLSLEACTSLTVLSINLKIIKNCLLCIDVFACGRNIYFGHFSSWTNEFISSKFKWRHIWFLGSLEVWFVNFRLFYCVHHRNRCLFWDDFCLGRAFNTWLRRSLSLFNEVVLQICSYFVPLNFCIRIRMRQAALMNPLFKFL